MKEVLQGHMTRTEFENLDVDNLMDDFMGLIDEEVNSDAYAVRDLQSQIMSYEIGNKKLKEDAYKLQESLEKSQAETSCIKAKIASTYHSGVCGTLQKKIKNRDRVIKKLKQVVAVLLEADDE